MVLLGLDEHFLDDAVGVADVVGVGRGGGGVRQIEVGQFGERRQEIPVFRQIEEIVHELGAVHAGRGDFR